MVVGKQRRYSPAEAMFLLRHKRYRTTAVEHVGAGGGPISHEHEVLMGPEVLDEIAERMSGVFRRQIDSGVLDAEVLPGDLRLLKHDDAEVEVEVEVAEEPHPLPPVVAPAVAPVVIAARQPDVLHDLLEERPDKKAGWM
jgi:hypothetical protein